MAANDLCQSTKTFGLELSAVSWGRRSARARTCRAGLLIAGIAHCMLRARAALWQEYLSLHKLVIAVASKNKVCRRFMGTPGVWPISASAFRTSVDDPRRSRRSKTVDSILG